MDRPTALDIIAESGPGFRRRTGQEVRKPFDRQRNALGRASIFHILHELVVEQCRIDDDGPGQASRDIEFPIFYVITGMEEVSPHDVKLIQLATMNHPAADAQCRTPTVRCWRVRQENYSAVDFLLKKSLDVGVMNIIFVGNILFKSAEGFRGHDKGNIGSVNIEELRWWKRAARVAKFRGGNDRAITNEAIFKYRLQGGIGGANLVSSWTALVVWFADRFSYYQYSRHSLWRSLKIS